MSTRKDVFQNHPLLGWFQYSNRFNTHHDSHLPRLNPFVGNFHHSNTISDIKYEYALPLEFLLPVYYRTLVLPIKRSIATQTDDDTSFILLELPCKN